METPLLGPAFWPVHPIRVGRWWRTLGLDLDHLSPVRDILTKALTDEE